MNFDKKLKLSCGSQFNLKVNAKVCDKVDYTQIFTYKIDIIKSRNAGKRSERK